MKYEKAISRAETELIKLDPKLGMLIEQQRPLVRKPRSDYFASLVRAIIGQQVSVAAATAIYNRLADVTDVKAVHVLHLTEQQIRHIGLSRQKALYVRDLAQHFVDKASVYSHFERASDEDIIHELMAVKGIGLWTAQMFLMFTLARLDVFAPGDAGLQRAMRQLYGWEETPTHTELEIVAQTWRPYRTVACWHLWESLHNAPVK